jgi:molybdopterin-guanine dinucleotide biosynthesis protein A
MTQKPVLLILAGGIETGDLFESYGCRNKALLPLHGKPMLDWVIEAFHASGTVDRIVVVGPPELDGLASMRHVAKRVDATPHFLRNILRGIAGINWMYFRRARRRPGYLITFCDAVFLNADIIRETVRNIATDDYDFVLHYVEKAAYDKNSITAKRTYIPIDGKFYTGSTIYYLRSFRKTLQSAHLLSELRARRKDPQGLLSVLGLQGLSLPQITAALSARINGKAAIFVSDAPGLGMDVDKVADYVMAEQLLAVPLGAGAAAQP